VLPKFRHAAGTAVRQVPSGDEFSIPHTLVGTATGTDEDNDVIVIVLEPLEVIAGVVTGIIGV